MERALISKMKKRKSVMIIANEVIEKVLEND